MPGRTYFAQHVGPASAFELIEFFIGPSPRTAGAATPTQRSTTPSCKNSMLDSAEATRSSRTPLATSSWRGSPVPDHGLHPERAVAWQAASKLGAWKNPLPESTPGREPTVSGGAAPVRRAPTQHP